jgi:putative two-component system response regulator
MVEENANRLLLVDDNLTNLKVLYQALEDEGYELLVSQSGEKALSIAKQAKPAVILLDINMPGIDGYETCRRLKEDPETADAIVVFLSARGDIEDKLHGFELGAVDYIGKPFQFEEVVARVRAHHHTYLKELKLKQEKAELKSQLTQKFRRFGDGELRALIQQGESSTLEFKSTLRWNLHTDKADKKMENVCLKTMAAFLNSEGGCLIVGVDDEGVALGMDKDNFSNEDKLLLHFNNLVKSHLGSEFCQHINGTVESDDGKRILVVQCLKSKDPVFFRRDQDEIFYVRSGPSTLQLSPSQLLAYLNGQK